MQPHRGRLLVATPVLADPNFARTVVLLLEHDDDGALGIVLNRPGEARVDEVAPGWERLAAAPDVVFGGGPVQPDAIVGLARCREPAPRGGPGAVRPRGPFTDTGSGSSDIVPGVRLIDLGRDAALAAAEVSQVRIFAGYAGWAPAQLEREVAEEAWVTVAARGGDVFSDDPADLWRGVLRRQPGRLRLLSTFPEAPWTN